MTHVYTAWNTPPQVKVFLDDVEMQHVTAACPDGGWLERVVVGSDGKFVISGAGSVLREKLYGVVRVVM